MDLPHGSTKPVPSMPTSPAFQGEEYLRTHHGAIILRVAGIYGPHRNPVDWIRRGEWARRINP